MDEEDLHTLLCEAEAVINSGPILKASSDLIHLEALMPNHLLLLKVKPELPQEYFIRMTNMPIADGDKFSTSRICPGHVGAKNTSRSYGMSTMVYAWKKLL